jgi:hypothetical protein
MNDNWDQEKTENEVTGLQFALLVEKIDSLRGIVEENNRHVQKILDDHEARLREQAAADSRQGQAISSLRVELAGIKSKQEAIETWQQVQDERRYSFWQEAALKLLPSIGFGGGAVSSIVILAQVLGWL